MTKKTLEEVFGANVKRARLAREMSQADLAAAINVEGQRRGDRVLAGFTQQQVAKLENASRPTRINQAQIIADALGEPLDDLLMLRALRGAQVVRAISRLEPSFRDAQSMVVEQLHEREVAVAAALKHAEAVRKHLVMARDKAQSEVELQRTILDGLEGEPDVPPWRSEDNHDRDQKTKKGARRD